MYNLYLVSSLAVWLQQINKPYLLISLYKWDFRTVRQTDKISTGPSVIAKPLVCSRLP